MALGFGIAKPRLNMLSFWITSRNCPQQAPNGGYFEAAFVMLNPRRPFRACS